MRLLPAVVVALLPAPVAVSAACYGPTEMTVELTTDVAATATGAPA